MRPPVPLAASADAIRSALRFMGEYGYASEADGVDALMSWVDEQDGMGADRMRDALRLELWMRESYPELHFVAPLRLVAAGGDHGQ